MKFLLPSKIPQFDFQFQLIASQDYWTNFKHNPLEIVYCDEYVNFEEAYKHGRFNDHCPVGSIEFCNKHGINTIPRNIPISLKEYAVGTVTNDITDRMLDGINKWHVKSNSVIKHPDNGIYSIHNLPPFINYQAVEFIEDGFESEYRVFVLDGNIVDIQNYAGDLWTLPDKYTVEKMIYQFEHTKGESVPPAYTLDVGVYLNKTYIVELHDFYSCGTYNFNDHYRFPMMLWVWWNWYRRKYNYDVNPLV